MIFNYCLSHVDAPVTFKAMGHNVVLGGSHNDEYWMDYISITPLASVDPSIFSPPLGMTCLNSQSPYGPTSTMGGDAYRSNPLHDIHMIFPEGESRRKNAFDSWASKYGKSYATQAEQDLRAAIFHSNLKFINSGNRRGLSYVMNVNHMADTTLEERLRMKGRSKGMTAKKQNVHAKLTDTAAPPNGDPTTVCNTYTGFFHSKFFILIFSF